ncbi:MAG: cell division protein ZapA [Oscillospiraceae bacterium]|nr:cell division protein ZapA [Oscillospiraceae bacterium]
MDHLLNEGVTTVSNRITITLGGKPYTVITDESEDYVQALAIYADAKFLEQRSYIRSKLDAALMALITVTDEYTRANERAESAAQQIQGRLEDATKARLEVSELRRELAAREKEIASLRSRLARFTGGAGYHTEGDY